MGDNTPLRYTKKQWSYETGITTLIIAALWKTIGKPCTDSIKAALPLRSLKYHPTAIAGITTLTTAYTITPWAAAALLWAVIAWALIHPPSYLKHVHSRTQSYLAGIPYHYRPRERLRACSVLRENDPTPTISRVTKIGCTTKVWIKMAYGHEIDWWREENARLAQTYNALDCKINPYRRQTLHPHKKQQVTKPRWLELEFLTKDPFNYGLGVEYINYHHTADELTLTPVDATCRNGQPHRHNLAAHRLRVAMTRWGKSNAIRAMIYAQRHNLKDGKLELWGIDGKGGVEQSFLQHLFARVAYGDNKAAHAQHTYDPTEFDRLLKDAVRVLKHRQQKMRGNATEHTPTPEQPWLLIVIDELLVLTSKAIHPDLRNSIAASIMLIQQQGIACGVSLDASTQLAQKDRIDFRDGFTEFELGKVERGAVDMIFGTGWWQRGARADEIAKDLKGVFYIKTDTTMVPEQIRYPDVQVSDVSPQTLGFKVEKSALWPLPASKIGANGTNGTNGHHKKPIPPKKLEPQPTSTNGTNGHHDEPISEDLKSVISSLGGFS